jgi:hypothetical protein
MDRGGLKTLVFLRLFESAFPLWMISGSFKYLLLSPMLPHSCPPARVTTQSLGREGSSYLSVFSRGVFHKTFDNICYLI